jgi:hypothetical protein
MWHCLCKENHRVLASTAAGWPISAVWAMSVFINSHPACPEGWCLLVDTSPMLITSLGAGIIEISKGGSLVFNTVRWSRKERGRKRNIELDITVRAESLAHRNGMPCHQLHFCTRQFLNLKKRTLSFQLLLLFLWFLTK